tara:strand:+ start:228 stop:377 length:150 start_codon:yes stop_codon:yes gene_type:complete
MLKQLIKKWLGLTEKADNDRVDDVEGELNNVASNVDDIISRLDDLEKEE